MPVRMGKFGPSLRAMSLNSVLFLQLFFKPVHYLLATLASKTASQPAE